MNTDPSQNERPLAFEDDVSQGAPNRKKSQQGLYISIVVGIVVGAALFAVVGPLLLSLLYNLVRQDANDRYQSAWSWFPLLLLGAIVGSSLGRRSYYSGARILLRWERKDRGDKINLYLGFFGGLVISLPVLSILISAKVSGRALPLLSAGVILGFSALVIFILQTNRDLLPWCNQTAAKSRSGTKILDTNVIIDGRVYDVVKSGFLEGELYVSKFVLEELQYIADNHDALKRNRGRRGLDVLRRLQAEFSLVTGRYDRYAPDPHEPVDSRLVRIAKAIGADIVTNDWNLNNVARLQGVRILSLNELALNLRPSVLPGEPMNLSILREGNQFGQGVGYLDDGTMVVVENGREHIGETRDVTVTQVIQTERGKMIFAEIEASGPESRGQKRR